MADPDYYATLGVPRAATADQIRTAYRTLARKLHPDVNKSPDAQKKFAQLQQAYDVLSDEKKRPVYDQFGDAGVRGAAAGVDPASAQQAWSNARRGWQNTPPRGTGTADFDLQNEELGDVFDAIFGAAGRGNTRVGKPTGGPSRGGARGAPEPQVAEQEIRVDFLTAAKGGLYPIRVGVANAPARTIEVKVPAGVEDGSQLRVRGALENGHGQKIDLALLIRVLPHDLWRRGEFMEAGKGLDLFLDLPLTIAEATLGTLVDVPALAGLVSLTVPPGTASGRKLRMKGLGIHDEQGRRGDLVAIAQVVPPSVASLSDIEMEVLKRIGAAGISLRTARWWRAP